MAIQPDVKTIILSGGGTGGHITPILAVAQELKRQDPSIEVVYIGERNGKFRELTDNYPAIDRSYSIWAGKFRRYNGESFLKRLFDIKTNLLNLRDMAYFGIGTVQSVMLLTRIKPTRVFLKGGFVGVPVGIAARLRHVPFMTHDSDAMPGLANRIVGRWAVYHAVAMAPEVYPYPLAKTVQVGVLVEASFVPVDGSIQRSLKDQIGIPNDAVMLLVTGGSSGARNINVAMAAIVASLLDDYQDLYIVHQAGKGKLGVYGDYTHERLTVLEFMRPMSAYTGAADIVISRASGNTVAELGVQGKAVIVVPNPLLTGGHQLKNAEALKNLEAALVVSETAQQTDSHQLELATRQLLDDPRLRQQLADRLQSVTRTDAAARLAEMLRV